MMEVFYNLICYVKLFLVGINCVFGGWVMCLYIEELVCVVECYVMCYLNVGLLNVFGGYDEMLVDMVVVLCEFVEVGLVNLVGGCCGLMLLYIGVIVKVVCGLLIWKLLEILVVMWLSGLEFLLVV